MGDETRYNMGNENENQKWEKDVAGQEMSGTVVERIDRSTLQTITKECSHSNVSRQPATEFDGDVTEISCDNCPIGWFERRE